MVERDKRKPADQDPAINAEITAEIERLADELAEVREQLAATSEVLAVIGRSASDLEGVLETVVESARKLCGADAGQVFLVDGDTVPVGIRLRDDGRSTGNSSPIIPWFWTGKRSSAGSGLTGGLRRSRTCSQTLTTAERMRSGWPATGQLWVSRCCWTAKLSGCSRVWRTQVDPFSDRAVEVLTTFAAQAALAVRTVDLVRALESRTDELGRKVTQLEALGAVGQAESFSLNLTEVLNTIITQAVQLSGTDGGSIYEFDEDAREFRVETVCGTSPEDARRSPAHPDRT